VNDSPAATETTTDRPQPAGPRPARPGRLTALLLAAILALVLVALVFAGKWSDARGDISDRDAVATQSGRFADRFLTLDSRDPSRTEQAVVALATGNFRRTFRQGFEAGLVQALVAVGQVRTEATVKEVFIGDIDSRSAHAIVHVGVVVHPIDRPTVTASRPDSWIELDLVKQGGNWLVDGVGDLRFGTSDADAGPPSTPTTAPPGAGSAPPTTR